MRLGYDKQPVQGGWTLHTRFDFRNEASASFNVSTSNISASVTLPTSGHVWSLRNYGNVGGGADFLDGLNIRPGEGLCFEMSRSGSYRDSQQDGPALHIALESLPGTLNLGPPTVPVRIAATLTNLGTKAGEHAGVGVYSNNNNNSDATNAFWAGTGHHSGSRHALWASKSTTTVTYPTSPPTGIFDAIMIENVDGSATVFWGSASADGTPPDIRDRTKWTRDSGSLMAIGNAGGQAGFGTTSNQRNLFLYAQNGGDTSSTYKPIFMVVEIWYMPNYSLDIGG